jgi:hypothetical protein
MKNTGHIRVDVRGQLLDMRISIKDAELDNVNGIFYIVIKTEIISAISIAEICMRNGEYNGRVVCDSKEYEYTFQLEDIIGVCVHYKNDCYLASCCKDGEEEVIAEGSFFECPKMEDEIEEIIEDITEEIIEDIAEDVTEEIPEDRKEDLSEVVTVIEHEILEDVELPVIAASISDQENKHFYETQTLCRKINLSEIYTLPSNYWHLSNNSFLLHGFWNYGYLVVKEEVTENEKRTVLGVPGIFEQPEMVMAAYFGFPKFEELPAQMVEMEIGENFLCMSERKNQLPQEGAFGCWFVTVYQTIN